jgi:hypothetical protein
MMISFLSVRMIVKITSSRRMKKRILVLMRRGRLATRKYPKKRIKRSQKN